MNAIIAIGFLVIIATIVTAFIIGRRRAANAYAAMWAAIMVDDGESPTCTECDITNGHTMACSRWVRNN